MKRFVWRLQRVLDVKTKEEQIRKSELIAVTEKLAQARGILLDLKRTLDEMISNLTHTNPRRRLGEQEFFLKHSTTIDDQISETEKRIADLEVEREAKADELRKVRQFREGLDKLRAEAKARFVEEEERAEQKELNEIATVRFARVHSGK